MDKIMLPNLTEACLLIKPFTGSSWQEMDNSLHSMEIDTMTEDIQLNQDNTYLSNNAETSRDHFTEIKTQSRKSIIK